MNLRKGCSLLDIGTGYVGVLAIFAKLHIECKEVHAVDYIPEIISSAKRNGDSLKLDIKFYYSNLFDNINERFDMIVFNAPYIDIENTQSKFIIRDKISERRFSGGKGGGETITRFLEYAPTYLTKEGVVVLGVTHYHISKDTIHYIISNSPFEFRNCIKIAILPGSAYLLTKKRSTKDD
ncbi:MAG: class I SAM-dependent methyltransferase [Candidatus Hatepunaea meridiana]|nr:class I SAM-dependent methyltransferase [Candidatus Hatepunaea meridiana]